VTEPSQEIHIPLPTLLTAGFGERRYVGCEWDSGPCSPHLGWPTAVAAGKTAAGGGNKGRVCKGQEGMEDRMRRVNRPPRRACGAQATTSSTSSPARRGSVLVWGWLLLLVAREWGRGSGQGANGRAGVGWGRVLEAERGCSSRAHRPQQRLDLPAPLPPSPSPTRAHNKLKLANPENLPGGRAKIPCR
jgi:hypothetical protein